MKMVKTGAFYLAVVVIVVVAVFPFYYAIVTSLKSGTALFEVNYLPREFNFDNYVNVMNQGEFPRNILNSVFVATMTVGLACCWGSPRPMRWRGYSSGGGRSCC